MNQGKTDHDHYQQHTRTDIALVEDSLSGVLYVRDLSNQTLRIVNQNFAIATSTNIIGVVAGALGLMGPVVAGMLHIVHTLGILANSGRLLQYQSTPE